MKKSIIILAIILQTMTISSQIPSKVDFEAYLELSNEVYAYRKDRLVNLKTFLEYAKDKKTVILDTRSKQMYDQKHIKGAINLNFSDFNQASLDALFPDSNTRILIYCNNNIDNDNLNFISKVVIPKKQLDKMAKKFPNNKKLISLALNIPTFINLYGYGFKNVYELSELINIFGGGLQFEGTLAGT